MTRKASKKMQKHKKANPKARHIKKAKVSTRAHAGRPAGMSARTKKMKAEMRAKLKLKAQKLAATEQAKLAAQVAEIERQHVEGMLGNVVFADFISKNVGKKAINVLKLLNEPQTDEKLAADLTVKINEVRRILNVLDSYGVARYDTQKDEKGWLTFKWYLDNEKLTELHQALVNAKPEVAYKLPDNCNDFFYCGRCYEEQKVILPFDAAFEMGFKCDGCGKQLKQLNKDEAIAMFQQNVSEKDAAVPAPV